MVKAIQGIEFINMLIRSAIYRHREGVKLSQGEIVGGQKISDFSPIVSGPPTNLPTHSVRWVFPNTARKAGLSTDSFLTLTPLKFTQTYMAPKLVRLPISCLQATKTPPHEQFNLLYLRDPRTDLALTTPNHCRLSISSAPHLSTSFFHGVLNPLIKNASPLPEYRGNYEEVPCFHQHSLSTCHPLSSSETCWLLTSSSFANNTSLQLSLN